jgi:hypothetical protein
MYAAYDALPPLRLKEKLEGRKGAFTYGGRRKATALLNPEDRETDGFRVFHPIVRVHPETAARDSTSIRQDPLDRRLRRGGERRRSSRS